MYLSSLFSPSISDSLHQFFDCVFLPGVKIPVYNVLSCRPDKVQIEGEVVLRRNHRRKHFARDEKVSQVCLRVGFVNKGRTIRIDRREIVGPFCIPHIHHPVPREEHSVAAVTGGHYAVEHVDAAVDCLQDIPWSSYAHKIARFVLRKEGAGNLQHLIHFLRGLPHCESSYGVSSPIVVIQGKGVLHGLLPKVRIHAALDDGKHGLVVSVERFALIESLCKAFQPVLGKPQGLCGIAQVRIPGAAFVKGHHNIGAYHPLGMDIVLRGEGMAGTVNVGCEFTSLLRKLTDRGKGKNLEAAAVSEDGPVPILESVKAAGLKESIQARSQVQVISVSEDNLSAYVLLQVPVIYSLHGTNRTYRHEDGGTDVSVSGGKRSRPCGGGTVTGFYDEFGHYFFKFVKDTDYFRIFV